MTVEHIPSWWDKMLFIKPKDVTYVGSIVWRELPSGSRVELFFEIFLEELLQSELTRRKHKEG
jgi:hypothetical protein